jgi:hypothetical protein
MTSLRLYSNQPVLGRRFLPILANFEVSNLTGCGAENIKAKSLTELLQNRTAVEKAILALEQFHQIQMKRSKAAERFMRSVGAFTGSQKRHRPSMAT